jgi:hypothetical protein
MTDAKFVTVLNKRFEADQLLSALGHVTAGLVGEYGDIPQMSFVAYEDADGGRYEPVSDWPFIVLRGKAGQIATFRTNLTELGLPAVVYLNTMVSGGSEAQQVKTRETSAAELEILALATFGERSQIDALTKRFSVWQ